MDQIADVEGTAAVPDIARGVQCDAGESRFDGQPLVSGRFAWRFALNDDTTTRRKTTQAPSAQAPRPQSTQRPQRRVSLFNRLRLFAVPRFVSRDGRRRREQGEPLIFRLVVFVSFVVLVFFVIARRRRAVVSSPRRGSRRRRPAPKAPYQRS